MFYSGENIYKNIIITKQNVGSQLILLNKFSGGTNVIPSQESVFPHLIIDTMLNINSPVNISSECPLSMWTLNSCWDLMCFHSSEDMQSCLLKSKHILPPDKDIHLLLFPPNLVVVFHKLQNYKHSVSN